MTAHGAALGAARKATKPATPRGGNPQLVVELEAQLDRLRRLEDPTNSGPTAVVYREMVAAADRSVMGKVPGHRPGDQP